MNDPQERIPRTREEASKWDPTFRFRAQYPTPELYVMRLIHKIWMNWNIRKLSARYTKELHDQNGHRWATTQSALQGIGNQCQKFDIPCVAVLFANLKNDQNHPNEKEHEQVKRMFLESGFTVLDVKEALLPFKGTDFRVHSTDGHPNEIVHRVVGKELAEIIAALL